MRIPTSDTWFLNESTPNYVGFFIPGCYASHEAIDFTVLFQKISSI